MKKKSHAWLIILSCVGLVLAAVATTLYLLNEWVVNVTLRGAAEQTVEVGSRYEELGAYAEGHGSIFKFINDTPEVEISGKVDTGTLGTYELQYTAEFHDGIDRRVRKVTVVDTQAPVIELKTIDDYYTLPGQPYEEEGFTATDNYDGDLTDQVVVEERDGVVYYKVEDSSGNQTEAEREIFYDDRDAPVLTLEAGDMTFEEGGSYEEPGYTAVDNVDGDITDKVTVEGEVNGDKPGTYTLTYRVKDAYENEATATRKVVVTEKPIPEPEPVVETDKLIYLTFDDGPGPYTERLLEILDKYDVKVTFFVTNQFPEYQDMIREEAKAGHSIGVHTYSHEFSEVYASDEAFWSDFEKMQDIIEEQTGSRTRLMRFPGGSSNSISRKYSKGIMTRLIQQAGEKDLVYFDWNVLSGDAGETKNSKQITKNILDGIAGQRISVVLCHDIHEYTVDAMEDMIQQALDDGYTFAALQPGSYTAHHTVINN